MADTLPLWFGTYFFKAGDAEHELSITLIHSMGLEYTLYVDGDFNANFTVPDVSIGMPTVLETALSYKAILHVYDCLLNNKPVKAEIVYLKT